jgi:hypothetical protein
MLRLNDGSQDSVVVQANGLVKVASGLQVLATTANAGNVLSVTGGLQVRVDVVEQLMPFPNKGGYVPCKC